MVEEATARVPMYQPQFARPKAPNETFYRAFTWPGTAFDAGPASRARLARKILVVEAGESVPWTKPEELHYDPDKPLPPLGGLFPDGFNAVFGDGTVRFIPKGTDEKALRGMITGTGE
jgi:hypothetical protein